MAQGTRSRSEERRRRQEVVESSNDNFFQTKATRSVDGNVQPIHGVNLAAPIRVQQGAQANDATDSEGGVTIPFSPEMTYAADPATLAQRAKEKGRRAWSAVKDEVTLRGQPKERMLREGGQRLHRAIVAVGHSTCVELLSHKHLPHEVPL